MTPTEDSVPEAVRQSVTGAPSARLEAIRAAALAELAKVPHTRPWWRDALPLVAVNLVVGLGATFAMQWNTVQHASAAGRAGVAAVLAAVLTLGGVLAVRPGGRGLRWAALGVVAAAGLGIVLAGSGVSPGGSFWAGASCAVTECMLALLPMVAAAVLLTRFAFDLGRALLGGAAAGAGGMLALHLHCPNGALSHLLLFHVLPWLLLAGMLAAFRLALPSKSHAP